MFSVVVPVYNEKDNIRTLLERTMKALRTLDEPSEILIVDDDSPDGTATEAEACALDLGARDMVRVIVRKTDRGLAPAVMEGFRQAKGDVLAVMDADLSHPPELLPKMLAPIRSGEADVTVASRRVKGGGVSNWPIKRRVISWGAGLMARPLVPVRDTTSGFFALKKEALEGVELRPIGYKIGLEVLARAKYKRAVEIPFVFTDRVAGTSKLGGAVIFAYLVQLAGLYRERFPKLVGFVQFGLVGLLGMAVDATVFSMGYWYLGLVQLGAGAGTFVAQTISFLAAAGFNFVLNRAWTFRERAAGARAGIFMLVGAGGFALRTPAIYALVKVGMHEIFALVIGIFLASIWNFLASRRWAFPKEGPAKSEEKPSESLLPADLGAHQIAMVLIIGLAILRIFYAGIVELTPDETYYWQWSRHLDWGYHDHPPMIAYLIRAGTTRVGDNAVGVRLLMAILSSATLFIVYRLARRWGGTPRAGLWAVIVMTVIPLFALGSTAASPDIPYIFFWTASISLTLKSLRTKKMHDWLLLGLALGLGMLSKYPMVLLPPALLVALLISSERRALLTPGPYLAAIVGALTCIPLLLWQLDRGFASVFFQLGHGLGAAAGSPQRKAVGLRTFGDFVGGQLGVVTPILLILMCWLLVRALIHIVRHRKECLAGPGTMGTTAALPILVMPAAVTFGVFGVASFLASNEVNWPAAAYPSLVALLGIELARWVARGPKLMKAVTWGGVGFAALLSVYALVEIAVPLAPLPDGVMRYTHGNAELGRWADGVREELSRTEAPKHVLADHYQKASLLAFYMKGQPQTDSPFEEGSGAQYVTWRTARPLNEGDSAMYITIKDTEKHVAQLMSDYRLVDSLSVVRQGIEIRSYKAYFGHLRKLE